MYGRRWIDSRYKRTIDILVVSVCSPLLVIIILVVMIVVGVVDNAVPLFYQERIGKNGTLFRFYKINTMGRSRYCDVGRGTQDQRATTFGRFLRCTILDETPQIIINVLRGDMALVGPRPVLQADIDLMRRQLSRTEFQIWFTVYKACRPGWTGCFGLASRCYESQSVEYLRARLYHDVAYLQEATPWIDLKVILIHFTLFYVDMRRRRTSRL